MPRAPTPGVPLARLAGLVEGTYLQTPSNPARLEPLMTALHPPRNPNSPRSPNPVNQTHSPAHPLRVEARASTRSAGSAHRFTTSGHRKSHPDSVSPRFATQQQAPRSCRRQRRSPVSPRTSYRETTSSSSTLWSPCPQNPRFRAFEPDLFRVSRGTGTRGTTSDHPWTTPAPRRDQVGPRNARLCYRRLPAPCRLFGFMGF